MERQNSSPGKNLNLLLVDDSDPLRQALEQWLSHTFHVKAFSNGAAAIKYLKEGTPVDILLTDFDLRSVDTIDGLNVAEAVRTVYPECPVILMTGSSREKFPRIDLLLAMPDTLLVDKPFEIKDLANLINAMLA